MLVLTGVFAIVVIMREPIIVEAPLIAWGVLTVWTMPAAAGVYYFETAGRLVKAWSRVPDYSPLNLRK